jgi:tetratricopeptide (TPR) repeat protein
MLCKPEYSEFTYNNGKAHQKLRNNQEALECFNKALKLDPNYKDVQKAKEEIISNKLKNSK